MQEISRWWYDQDGKAIRVTVRACEACDVVLEITRGGESQTVRLGRADLARTASVLAMWRDNQWQGN